MSKMQTQKEKPKVNFAKYIRNTIIKTAAIAVVVAGFINGPDIARTYKWDIGLNSFLNMSPLVERMEDLGRGIKRIFGHTSSDLYSKKKMYEPYVKEAADKYLNGDVNMVWATMMTESEMNERDVSCKGARGLMQLMPEGHGGVNLFDPKTNIELGVKELARYKMQFKRWDLAFAAYNSGPNRDSIKCGKIPQITETQYYVPKVLAYYDCFKNMQWPVYERGAVDSAFGMRRHPIYHVNMFHYGIDIDARLGDPARAALDGKVVRAEWTGKSGYRVDLEKEYWVEGSKRIYVTTMYSHLSVIIAKKGTYVKRGQIVGRVGSTGLSTGPHLDFKVTVAGQFVDPLVFLGEDAINIVPSYTLAKAVSTKSQTKQ